MCGSTLLFILCAGAITDAFPREIIRHKRTFDFERWLWGSFGDNAKHQSPIQQTNFSLTLSLNFGVIPEFKLTATSSNSDYKLDLLNIPPKKKRRKSTIKDPDTLFTSNMQTKPTVSTTSSTSQTKQSDPPTSSTTGMKVNELSSAFTIEIKSTDPPNVSATTYITDASSIVTSEINSTDPPNTPTTDNKPDASSLSKIETVITKPSSVPLAALRLLNSSDSSPEDNYEETETTTEEKKTDATSISPGTTTANYCDPLPAKPDFSAPERRINEEKCMGYVWELRNRIRQAEQDLLCKRRLFVSHVVGGIKTEVGEFPHMGAVGWKAATGTWVFKCGSSLISSNFVLTAAHCTKASPRDSSIADPVPKIVRLGDKKIDDKRFFSSPTDANISRIIMHPQYSPPMKYYDIALMELEEPVEFTRLIQPACLWNSFSTADHGHEATLTGWGVIESGSLENSPELQAATVDVLENEQCDGLLQNAHNRNWKGFRENQLCAGKLEGGVDSCQGDSGGPLQMKMNLSDYETDRQGQMHYVIGVISFGVGCAHKNLPGIYTRVSSFTDWIEDNVWRNGNERVFVPPPESNILDF